MITQPQSLLMLRFRVENANAISSPLTWGFPSPTAFTGFVHALSLRLQKDSKFKEIDGFKLDGVGICCNRFAPQIATPEGKRTHIFSLQRHPIGQDGSPQAIVEAGRAHFVVTLVVGVYGSNLGIYVNEVSKNEALAKYIYEHVCSMKLAGGSIFAVASSFKRPTALLTYWPNNSSKQIEQTVILRQKLLPTFTLLDRTDVLKNHLQVMQNTKADVSSLDALLDLSRLNFECTQDSEDSENVDWQVKRKQGWLVPLPVGYIAISELHPAGSVKNARDKNKPFCFVENILSLGEWRSPHRINNLSELLWYHHFDSDLCTYRCIQPFTPTPSL